MRKYRVNTSDGIVRIIADAASTLDNGNLRFIRKLKVVAEFPHGSWSSYMEESVEKGSKEVG